MSAPKVGDVVCVGRVSRIAYRVTAVGEDHALGRFQRSNGTEGQERMFWLDDIQKKAT